VIDMPSAASVWLCQQYHKAKHTAPIDMILEAQTLSAFLAYLAMLPTMNCCELFTPSSEQEKPSTHNKNVLTS